MVSGYDKHPPEPRYKPELGPGGNFAVYAMIALVVAIVGRIIWDVAQFYL